MTGAEIILKQGNNYVLFKVRHDGYFVDEYFIDKKKLFKHDFKTTMKEFIKAFASAYGSPGAEIVTFFPDGFATKLSKKYNVSDLYESQELGDIGEDLEEKMREELIKAGKDPDEEGMFCGYADHFVLLDFDEEKGYGFGHPNLEDVVYKKGAKIVK